MDDVTAQKKSVLELIGDDGLPVFIRNKCCACGQSVILRKTDPVICNNINPITGKKCYSTQVMKERAGWIYGTCR